MRHKKKISILLIILALISFSGCKKEDKYTDISLNYNYAEETNKKQEESTQKTDIVSNTDNTYYHAKIKELSNVLRAIPGMIVLFLLELVLMCITTMPAIRTSMNAFIVLQDGKTYIMTAQNNTGAYAMIGLGAGNLLNNVSEGLGQAAKAVGTAASLITMEKANKNMENPQSDMDYGITQEYAYALDNGESIEWKIVMTFISNNTIETYWPK